MKAAAPIREMEGEEPDEEEDLFLEEPGVESGSDKPSVEDEGVEGEGSGATRSGEGSEGAIEGFEETEEVTKGAAAGRDAFVEGE
jgi:hypothetical protein